MAQRDVQSLFLQVDASVELLRRNLAAGEQPLDRFEQRAAKMATNVDASIQNMGKRFGAFATLAETAAQKAERSFNDSFSQIQKMAATALQSPSSAGGGLNVGAADVRAAATAAQQQAAALTLIEQAAVRASAGEGQLTAETRLYLQAASAARIEAERRAGDLTREAGALEALEIELQKAGAAQQLLAARGNNAVAVNRQQSTATVMLGQQVQDFAVQVSAGGSVVTAFSQQIGQAAFAIQMMGGRMQGLATFLTSGWGQAATLALVVLGPFVAKLFEGGDAADKSARANRTLSEVLHDTSSSYSEVIKALDAYNLAKEREHEKTAAGLRVQEKQIEKNYAEAISTREATKALLERYDALQNNPTVAGQTPGLSLARQQIAGSQSKNDAEIAKLEEALKNTRSDLAEILSDPEKKIRDHFTSLREQAAAAIKDTEKLTQRYAELHKQEEAALKSARDATRPVSEGVQVDRAAGQALFDSAASYRGLSESSNSGTLKDLLKQAGTNVDPKMVAWCAAFVNAVLATNGLPGTGSLSARSFLNYGQATSTPTVGDIVVSKRGNDAANGHVGFYQGTDAKGNILVLGGNTGNKVGTEAVARKDVLAFRRADAGSAQSLADRQQRAAEQAAEKLQRQEDTYSQTRLGLAQQLIDARRQTVTSAEELARLDIEEINAARIRTNEGYKAAEAEGRLAKGKADELIKENDAVAAERAMAVVQRERARKLDEQLRLDQEDAEDKMGVLRLQAQLATTLADRKRIAQEILDLETQERTQAAQRLLQSPNERDQAEGRRQLQAISHEQPLRQQDLERNFASPMEQYVQHLQDAVGGTDQLNESLQHAKANGLQSFEDGLVGIISGTESVKQAFKRMADQIIADLARIAIEKLILGTLFSFGTSGPANLLSGTPFARDGGRLEGFAAGGRVIRGAGSGTSDSILALVAGRKPIAVSNGESINTADATARYWPLIEAMNAGRLPRFAAGGLVSPRLPKLINGGRADRQDRLQVDVKAHVEAGPMFDARVEAVSIRTVAAAAEPIMSGAEARTRRSLERPRLPGGFG